VIVSARSRTRRRTWASPSSSCSHNPEGCLSLFSSNLPRNPAKLPLQTPHFPSVFIKSGLTRYIRQVRCRPRARASVAASRYTSTFYLVSSRILTRRRVSTSHQRVCLEIDFSGSLWVRVHASAELPKHPHLLCRATRILRSTLPPRIFELSIFIRDNAVSMLHL
jgi:hypothetical protein